MDTVTMFTLPLDWNEWQKEWREWYLAHAADMRHVRSPFKGKNFLADEILGTWMLKNGRTVELSEVTFPNLSERDERGNLLRHDVRGIGITFADGETDVVHSFGELEDKLGLTTN